MRALAALADLLSACGSDAATTEPSPQTCSTGTAHAGNEVFPVVEDTRTYPRCLPRCAYGHGGGGVVSLDGLPNGSCAGASSCSISVSYTCESTSGGLGRLDGMRCDCANGTWACVITSQGGGVCPQDAGAR